MCNRSNKYSRHVPRVQRLASNEAVQASRAGGRAPTKGQGHVSRRVLVIQSTHLVLADLVIVLLPDEKVLTKLEFLSVKIVLPNIGII